MGVRDKSVYPQIKDLLGIPQDEPIFILRAQDLASVPAIDYYLDENEKEGNDPSWLFEVTKLRDGFADWQIKNSDKTKRAD